MRGESSRVLRAVSVVVSATVRFTRPGIVASAVLVGLFVFAAPVNGSRLHTGAAPAPSFIDSITVNDVPPSSLSYSTNPAVYRKGTAIANNTPSSGGGPVVSYGISPALPAGLSFSTSTGVISGTPTVVSSATSYTVTATNSGGDATTTLTITVTDVNRAPVIDSVSVGPAGAKTNDVLTANVTSHDPDGDAVSYSYQWLKNGSEIVGATGVSLNLATAGNGDKGDSITVRVVGNDGALASAAVTSAALVVANTAPSCSAVALVTTDEGSTGEVDPTCTDADGDTLTFSIASGASHGTASVVAGRLHYAPNSGYSGSDSFTYKGSDGADESSAATVSVTVSDGTHAATPATTVARPNTKIVKAKIRAAKHMASFSFKGTGGKGKLTFQCRLDGKKYKSCRSGKTYKHLKRGKHVFRVRAKGSNGKVDLTPATKKFKI